MKIVSWNACCKFREKYKEIATLDADVYVIQECENPAACDDADYRAFVKNGFWVGDIEFKGLMVFTTRPDVKLERLDWGGDDRRFFIPVRVNSAFNLVAAWACEPYCEELCDWLDAVADHINPETIIIGDLNSNVKFDTPKRRRMSKGFADAIARLEKKSLVDMWHHHHKEEHGAESMPTFYLYRHLDKGDHIDHCFAYPDFITGCTIHARVKWLNLSDHLPIEIVTIPVGAAEERAPEPAERPSEPAAPVEVKPKPTSKSQNEMLITYEGRMFGGPYGKAFRDMIMAIGWKDVLYYNFDIYGQDLIQNRKMSRYCLELEDGWFVNCNMKPNEMRMLTYQIAKAFGKRVSVDWK